MASFLDNLSKIIPFKGKPKTGGVANTSTLNPSGRPTRPQYRDHSDDILATRLNDDSNQLIELLMRSDPDVSAAVNAYLTVANTDMQILAYDPQGQIDAQAIQDAKAILTGIETRLDYSTKFEFRPNISAINEGMRTSLLKTGAIAVELVFNKLLIPNQIRFIDPTSVQWTEAKPGEYKPQQRSQGKLISLDSATIFIQYFRRDPTKIYSFSPFVAAINTIAARQQVVNDLYRIMKRVGYPRIEATLVEEAIINSAPPEIKKDPSLLNQYKEQIRSEIEGGLNALAADTAVVHGDSMELKILNKEGPGKSMDATSIIEVLNASNQAALKTMATIIGRGSAGVNTASVEASIFTKNADELNDPVACVWSQMLTFALRMAGSQSRVEVHFTKGELRPSTELEPNLSIRQGRLENALSQGLITDQEFHLKMFGRIKPEGLKDLSGSGFKSGTGNQVDPNKVSPNNGPIGRAITAPSPRANKSNSNKK